MSPRDKSKIGRQKVLVEPRWISYFHVDFHSIWTWEHAFNSSKSCLSIADWKQLFLVTSIAKSSLHVSFLQPVHVRTFVVLTSYLAACRCPYLSVVRELNGFWPKHILVSGKGKINFCWLMKVTKSPSTRDCLVPLEWHFVFNIYTPRN